GAGVVPAVLASAEGFGKFSGKDVILATVVGYELGTRIGNTVSPHAFHRGFHPCGLTSTFASAAAIGKMLKLDTDQFVSALGLAGSQAAGLMASQFGAMAKRFHSGMAAQNGIIAALCAREGLTGVRNVLEAPYGDLRSTYSETYDLDWAKDRHGPAFAILKNGIIAALGAREGLTGVRNVLEAPYGGFCSTYAETYDLDWATNGLGTDFEICKNGFKQYSSLASSQTSVDAMRAIRAKHNIRGEDVEKVVIRTTNMVLVH